MVAFLSRFMRVGCGRGEWIVRSARTEELSVPNMDKGVSSPAGSRRAQHDPPNDAHNRQRNDEQRRTRKPRGCDDSDRCECHE